MGITRKQFHDAVRHRFGEIVTGLMIEHEQQYEQAVPRAVELIRKELDLAVPELTKESSDGKEAK